MPRLTYYPYLPDGDHSLMHKVVGNHYCSSHSSLADGGDDDDDDFRVGAAIDAAVTSIAVDVYDAMSPGNRLNSSHHHQLMQHS